MKKSKISLIIIITLAFSALPLSLFVFARAEPVVNLPDYEPIEVGPEFRNMDYEINFDSLSATPKASLRSSAILDAKVWMTLDSVTGYYIFDLFYLREESATTEVWVQADLSWASTTDPRPEPVVTDDEVSFLINEFDTVIRERDTTYFGEPDFHDGTYSLLEAWGYFDPGYYGDEDGKDVILISNIRDDAFYDPLYPAYIVGFYSPSFEAYFDRNIISIDCYNYTLRLGEGDPTHPKNRPYIYDGTIAHEYQHLIHDDYYPEDALYMNEACSLYAEPLCLADQPGYELDTGQIEWFMKTPDNSLTEWGDQGDLNILADYGSSFLWSIYLEEQYGPNFLSQYVQGNLYGLPTDAEDRISTLLPGGTDFNDVYHDWRIANLLDTKIGSSTKYNYEMIELSELEMPLYMETIDQYGCYIGSVDFPSTFTHPSTKYPSGFDTGITTMNPYSTDYINFDFETDGINLITFDGQDYSTVESWVIDNTTFGIDAWWSGQGDLVDRLIYGELSVGTGDQILYLDTLWDIEDYWDFGFVQVSTDNGATWTSLPDMDGYTVDDYDPNAHPDIIANLPGITSWVPDWVTLRYDLSAYSGDILIGFRYMTDWATNYGGWWIANAWYGNASLTSENKIALMEWTQGPEVDYMVTIVEKFVHGGKVHYTLHDMWIKDDLTELGLAFSVINRWEDLILIVSPMFEIGYTDYSFCAASVFRCKGR